MGARFRSWWQNIRKPLDTVIITLLVALLVLIGIVIIGYLFNWGWTGLGPYTSPPHPKDSDFQRGKTLWDWLQLLIIPAVLAVGGYVFNYTTSKNEQKSTQLRDQTERDITLDNQREDTLQSYIDKISELMLHENLRESSDEEVGEIARVRTLTVLRRLDAERKVTVLQLLHESGLIDKDKRIIDLSEADLSEANLRRADLNRASLSGANLYGASLSGANLFGADLSGANMGGAILIADLSIADLRGANLSRAILRGANLFGADLGGADLGGANLRGANLSRAILRGTSLSGANLYGANLHGADLSGAILNGANLDEANLDGATVTPEQLDTALKDTNMPDGSKHP